MFGWCFQEETEKKKRRDKRDIEEDDNSITKIRKMEEGFGLVVKRVALKEKSVVVEGNNDKQEVGKRRAIFYGDKE